MINDLFIPRKRCNKLTVCRMIWSRVFLFQLVVFSVYICFASATERWYAVTVPHKCNQMFSKKQTLIYILLVCLWSLLLCCSNLVEVGYDSSFPPSRRCQWQPIHMLACKFSLHHCARRPVFPKSCPPEFQNVLFVCAYCLQS